jgi:uncharacterized protein YkwD
VHHSNKLASTLIVLLCAALTVSAAALPVSASAHARTAEHHKRSQHAKATCTGHTASRTPASAHAASRACHASATKTPRVHHAKSHKPPKAVEAPSTEAAAASLTSQQSAASIASVLATPCQNTEITPEGANLQLARGAVLCLINQERAAHGIAPLAASPQLEQAAEGHAQELVQDNYFAHVTPAGVTPVDRIRETGYIPGPEVGYVIGENLAWGTYTLATPSAIVAAWIASPGHLANILESQYRETGIGITPAVPVSLGEGEPGATYAQEFGVIIE